MSYVDIVNGFWRYHKGTPVGGKAIQLFFYLCNVNNYYQWEEWFYLPRDTMAKGLQMSHSTIGRCLNELETHKLLVVQKRGGTLPNKYSIKRALRYSPAPPNPLRYTLRYSPEPSSIYKSNSNNKTDKRGGDSKTVTPPLTPPPKPTNGKPPPRLFISELKVKREVLADRLRLVRNRAHECPTGGLRYSNPKDLELAKELKQRIRAVEDQMLDG